MKRLGNILRKDIILGIKDVYILLEIGFSIVVMALLLFVVPKNIDRETPVVVFDSTGMLNNMMKNMDKQAGREPAQVFVNSRDEVVAGMKKNKAAVGLIIRMNSDSISHVELLTQPYTTKAMVETIKLQLTDFLSMAHPPHGLYPPDVYRSVKVTALQEDHRAEIPFNKKLLPVIIMFMVGMMGLFAMVSLIGQERSDETIRAYKVTPSRLWQFLLSKHLLLLATGLITFSIFYLPIMGFNGYFLSLLIIIPTIILGSGIGVLLGTFFDNPMTGVGWVLLFMVVFSLPAVSFFAPVFSPGWMKLIPSYYTLFGLDAAMFPDHNIHVFWSETGILSAIAVVLVTLSGWVFTKRLRKEV
ncbi:MAG: ABC transporter permease [Bacteroidales bacterium]|nr:ABC transporter permease [Bacteroidales bacterium]